MSFGYKNILMTLKIIGIPIVSFLGRGDITFIVYDVAGLPYVIGGNFLLESCSSI